MGIMINMGLIAVFGAVLFAILITVLIISKAGKGVIGVVGLVACSLILLGLISNRPAVSERVRSMQIAHPQPQAAAEPKPIIEIANTLIGQAVAATVESSQVTAVSAKARDRQPAIWQDKLELNIDVDTHSSLELACEGLVRNIINDDVFSDDSGDVKVYVCSFNTAKSEIADKAVNKVCELLNEQLAEDFDLQVVSSASAAMLKKDNPEGYLVEVELSYELTEKEYNVKVCDGTLNAYVSRGSETGKSSYTKKFSDANWMNEQTDFSRDLPGSAVFVTGCSQQSCPDIGTAKREALEDAVFNLNRSLGFEDMVLAVNDVVEHNSVQDVFVQQINGSEGSIFRCKVLLAGEAAEFMSMAKSEALEREAKAEEVIIAKKNSFMTLVKNLAVMLVSILGCYFICDYVTKGYYKGRIIAVIILVLVGGVLVLLKM